MFCILCYILDQEDKSHPSKSELNAEFVYMLCMREVPRYLQAHLCKSPALNSGSNQRISRFSDKNPSQTVILPPKPQFQFVQDNQVS